MSQRFAIGGVIALAVISANLPFLNERVFMLFRWRSKGVPTIKPFGLRLFELFVLYCGVGLIGFVFEERVGHRVSQTWQFYIITLCLFLILAFPGFVVRYVWRSKLSFSNQFSTPSKLDTLSAKRVP